MDFKQYFLYQADYQHWANDLMFNALDRLDDEARKGKQQLYFSCIHDSVDHLAFFHHKWLTRLKGDSPSVKYTDTLHADWRELKNVLRHETRELQRWLEQQTQSFFDTLLHYRRTEGQEEKSIWARDCLTHIFTYASLERGHITAIAATLGAPLPDMSYYAYRREMGEHVENIRKMAASEPSAEK